MGSDFDPQEAQESRNGSWTMTNLNHGSFVETRLGRIGLDREPGVPGRTPVLFCHLASPQEVADGARTFIYRSRGPMMIGVAPSNSILYG